MFIRGNYLTRYLPNPTLVTNLRLRGTMHRNVRPRGRPISMLFRQSIRPGITTRDLGTRLLFRVHLYHINIPINLPFQFNNPRICTIPLMRLPPHKTRHPTKDVLFYHHILLIPRPPFNIMSRRPNLIPTQRPRVRMVPNIRRATRHPTRIRRPNIIRSTTSLRQRTTIPNRRTIEKGMMRRLYRRTRTLTNLLNRTPTLCTRRLVIHQTTTMRLIRTILLRRRRVTRANNYANGKTIATRIRNMTIQDGTPMTMPINKITRLTTMSRILLTITTPCPINILNRVFRPKRPPPYNGNYATHYNTLTTIRTLPNNATHHRNGTTMVTYALNL